MAFCEKHKVSCDWLLCDDLACLQRMTRERKRAAEPDEKWVRFLGAALETVPPNLCRDAIEAAMKIAAMPWSAGADRSGSATGSG